MKITELTQEYLLEILDFDFINGKAYWKNRPLKGGSADRCIKSWNSRYGGTSAGSISGNGYVIISINKGRFLFHRVLWLACHGVLPEECLDHIDRNRENNKINNLRLASWSENGFNKIASPSNTSGFKGVSFCKKSSDWKAQAQINGINRSIGHFNTKEEASDAYHRFAKENHGDFYLIGV